MAESLAATQSPSISSSSSGAEPSALGSGGSPGACPALGAKSCGSSCADSFVSSSSSQPVSIFSTSQGITLTLQHCLEKQSKILGSQLILAKEGKDPLVLLGMKRLDLSQGTNKDRVDTLVFLTASGPCNHSSIPDSFPEQPAFLSKETGSAEEWIVKDQEPKNPNKVPSEEDRSALDLGQSKTEHICTYSLSPSELSGASVEKDSPESPFEVIIDKATFDREFKDLYKESTNDLGRWAAHSDRESPADLLEMDDKVFPLRNKETGRYPASALLSRQFSHTTAALEEVSRCVNDMHNFTNEILTWDLVPQTKQQADKSSCTTKSTGLDRSEHHSEIPVINLKTNTHQKMPVCSLNGNTPITKSTDDWAEASFSPENISGKPIKDYHLSSTKASDRGMSGSSQPLPEPPGSVPEKWVSSSGATTMEVSLPNLRDAWPNCVLGEVTEVDSSGESDDTVIEDVTADPSFETNKVLPEKPDSRSGTAAKTSARDIKETPSCETVRSEMCENSEEPSSASELHQAQPKTPTHRSLEGEVCSQVPNTLNEVAPEKPAMTDNPQIPSTAPPSVLSETGFPLTVTASANLESLLGKYVEDTDGSSPEDLLAAFIGAREKGLEGKEHGSLEAVLEKTADFKNAFPVELLHEHELGGSETKYSEHSKETNGGELSVLSSQGALLVSPDLEQEQLTIRAIKELGERQAEQVQAEGAPPGGKLKQAFALQSLPQRSSDILEKTDVETAADLGISRKPSIIKDTRVDPISNLSKTETVNKHALARLLSDFSGNHLYQKFCMAYLDVDITLSSEAFHNYMNAAMVHVNRALKLIIRLFLVEDLVDSLKLAVFMWLMTYVGAVFNGITLLILAELLVFSVPIVYEKYKTQIDHYVGIARDQTKSIVEKIQAKLPGIAKKKAE
ncbi:Rtn3 [Phodopus roborovskii]|uniref:Reticulon n=1 Tax=Phodopus roborovskii TaxID=109678 RepID=A0AAU9ZLX9_PHORO|nr:Rtn3 [Phodopus roborovskii]